MKIRIDTPIARLAADLPEDRVKDLLRIALEYATGGTGSTYQPAAHAPAAPPAKLTGFSPKITVPKEDAKPRENPTENGYKGFLYIKCEECGNTKGFCVKAPIKENRCDCGHTTQFKDLKPLYVNCKCGDSFKYMTNLTENTATIDCIHCGSPVDLEYHANKGLYQTIGYKRKEE